MGCALGLELVIGLWEMWTRADSLRKLEMTKQTGDKEVEIERGLWQKMEDSWTEAWDNSLQTALPLRNVLIWLTHSKCLCNSLEMYIHLSFIGLYGIKKHFL